VTPDVTVERHRGVMAGYMRAPNFAAATIELISWACRQHSDRGIRVYARAFEAASAALRHASNARPLELMVIEEITYVVATIADGFAPDSHDTPVPDRRKSNLASRRVRSGETSQCPGAQGVARMGCRWEAIRACSQMLWRSFHASVYGVNKNGSSPVSQVGGRADLS
jgi:hypothetical protein